jgi:hypothetical protein
MKKQLFSLTFLVTSIFSFAQSPTFQWANGMGGTSAQSVGRTLDVDASGNVYTTGYFNSTVDFDPGAGVFNLTAIGSTDAFISKLDAAGNFVWAKQIGGTLSEDGISIKVDASSNLYIAGLFNGTADFDPDAGTYNMTSIGNVDIFILKLNPTGNFLWAKQLGGSSSEGVGSIAIDGTGNVYTTGYFGGVCDFDPGPAAFSFTSMGTSDAFVSKLDASGNFVWAKQITGTSNEYANGVSIDPSGNVYIAGSFDGVVDLDPSVATLTVNTVGMEDVYITKITSTGNLIWAKTFGGVQQDHPYSMTIDGLGNVYSTGFFYGVVDFDPGASTYTLATAVTQEIFISKLNSSGSFVWAKKIGGQYQNFAYGISVDQQSNVYTTGEFQSSVDFDPGPGTASLTAINNMDIFISKLDINGNYVWAESLGGSGSESGNFIYVDASGSIYSTGYFSGIGDFDPGAGVYNLNAAGTTDIYIHKLGQTSNVGITENKITNKVNIYPIPSSEVITIELGISNTENIKVQLENTFGQNLLEDVIDNYRSSFNIQYLSSGIYLLKIMSDREIIYTQKIIKE